VAFLRFYSGWSRCLKESKALDDRIKKGHLPEYLPIVFYR
jgi:hypothetical protein